MFENNSEEIDRLVDELKKDLVRSSINFEQRTTLMKKLDELDLDDIKIKHYLSGIRPIIPSMRKTKITKLYFDFEGSQVNIRINMFFEVTFNKLKELIKEGN